MYCLFIITGRILGRIDDVMGLYSQRLLYPGIHCFSDTDNCQRKKRNIEKYALQSIFTDL